MAASGIVAWGYLLPYSSDWGGFTQSLPLALVSGFYFEILSGYFLTSLLIVLKTEAWPAFRTIAALELLFAAHLVFFAAIMGFATEAAIISFVIGLVAAIVANVASYRLVAFDAAWATR